MGENIDAMGFSLHFLPLVCKVLMGENIDA